VAQESRTQEFLHKVLEKLKEELKFLPVMAREQVPESDLRIDSMTNFKRSISALNVSLKLENQHCLVGLSCLNKY